jgi:hypothetical protein
MEEKMAGIARRKISVSVAVRLNYFYVGFHEEWSKGRDTQISHLPGSHLKILGARGLTVKKALY